MSDIISKAALEARRIRFKPGTRVELVAMSDPYTTLKPGDRGSVSEVDDIGTVFVNWDTGSTLGAAYGADEIKALSVIPPEIVVLTSRISAVKLRLLQNKKTKLNYIITTRGTLSG